jgi:cystathionine beta-lyase
MVQTNNVVSALGGAVRAFTQPGDKVVIQTPVYPPFYHVVTGNDRTLVENPLIQEGMDYRMDLDDLAEKLKGAKLLILCSPHNPVGRVWSREELEGVAHLCLEHNVLVVSDEIHADLLMNGHVHIPFAALGEEVAQHCLVCTSASKTFSFAGLACANIIIPNEELRRQFTAQRQKDGFGTDSIFGMRAMEAAYRDDSGWYEAMLAYVWDNYLYLKQFLADHIPQAGLADLQGTYLAWADLSCLGLEPDALMTFLRDEAALFLNDGRMFGEKTCACYVRVNLACPRKALSDGLDRLLAACQKKNLL